MAFCMERQEPLDLTEGGKVWQVLTLLACLIHLWGLCTSALPATVWISLAVSKAAYQRVLYHALHHQGSVSVWSLLVSRYQQCRLDSLYQPTVLK